jgi:YVTN family beta-propeller protein
MSLFELGTGQARARLAQAGALLAIAVFAVGCGNGYRPVITPINPTGPAPQPSSLVAVVSSTGPTTPGEATIIDYSGDTIMAQATIGPGPLSFSADETGSNGYTVNSDGTITNFPISTQLQFRNVEFTTLPTTANIVNLFSPSGGLWASDLDGNVADALSGFPATFKLAIPVAPSPVQVVGPITVMERDYVISQNFTDTSSTAGVTCNVAPRSVTALGEADAIEQLNDTVSARIPLGVCPVFGIETTNGQRLFVLNRGDDTITVINSADNTLDACTPFLNQSGQLVTCHPTLPLSTSAVTATGITPPNGTTGMPAIAGPVYAEYNAATSQLIVSDYDGNAISVIDVSLDEYGNDSQTFGTTYSIPVGTNPASVTALFDGSRAYTANQADGTVSIVDLSSHTLEKTVPVNGHPRTVVSTENSLYGKVYVASPDSPYLTIIRTDQDIIDATVLVQGNIIDARTTTQNGAGGNAQVNSRKPGFGQPCYQPLAALPAASITAASCSALPTI